MTSDTGIDAVAAEQELATSGETQVAQQATPQQPDAAAPTAEDPEAESSVPPQAAATAERAVYADPANDQGVFMQMMSQMNEAFSKMDFDNLVDENGQFDMDKLGDMMAEFRNIPGIGGMINVLESMASLVGGSKSITNSAESMFAGLTGNRPETVTNEAGQEVPAPAAPNAEQTDPQLAQGTTPPAPGTAPNMTPGGMG